MPALLIQVCVFTLFIQISCGYLNNNDDNKINKNLNHDSPPQINKAEIYQKCVLADIIKQIEELLKKQIKQSEFKIKIALKPEENATNFRTVRKSENKFDLNKCVLRSEMEQHKNLETEHILAIKKELEKLQELVRLLRDQQYVLNMLNDFDSKPQLKTDDDDDQKQLVELFKLLKNNLPAQAKTDNVPLPISNDNTSKEDLKQIMNEIGKLQKQLEIGDRRVDEKLKLEVTNQRNQLQSLQNEIEHLRNGQAIFVHSNPNHSKANTNNVSEIVGANLSKISKPTLIEKLKPKAFSRKASENTQDLQLEIQGLEKQLNKKSDSFTTNPKVRAGNDEFFETLQKLLDNSESSPEIKENAFDLNFNTNSDVENRLQDLEKQLKVSEKIQKLEKKIKQLHDSNAESKSIDDEDEDLKTQLKKLQRQLKNMNKNKAESKDLDEENILDELKSLQNAIDDLKPKEDTSQSKIGGAELQFMINKIIGVPTAPVRPVASSSSHRQLTPAQIQILRRVMAMQSGGNQQFGHSHGGSGYGEPSAYEQGSGPQDGGQYSSGYGQGGGHYSSGYGQGGGQYGPGYGQNSGQYGQYSSGYGQGGGHYSSGYEQGGGQYGPGYGQNSGQYGQYSTYGPGGHSNGYDSYYNGGQQPNTYDQGIAPYSVYETGRPLYGNSNAYGHTRGQYTNANNGPYGPNPSSAASYEQYGFPGPYGFPNKFDYSAFPYGPNKHFGVGGGQYNQNPVRGKYGPSNKYAQHTSNIAQYIFGGVQHRPNNGQYRSDIKPYTPAGGYYAPEVHQYGYGNSYEPSKGYGNAGAAGGYVPSNGYEAGGANGAYKPNGQYNSNGYGGVHKPAAYTAAVSNQHINDGGNYGNTNLPSPQKGYNQADQQLFRDYQNAEPTNYQSDASQSYANPQEDSYSTDSYAQQKMEDLQTQIYKLQNVINNLNRPEYVQKPEDQQTIYELDHKINSLKGIVSNLAHDTNPNSYQTGYQSNQAEANSYNYGGEGHTGDAYDGNSNAARSRFRRDLKHNDSSDSTLPNVHDNSTMHEFLEHLADIVSVIHYISDDFSQKHHETNDVTTKKTRKVREISQKFSNEIIKFFHGLGINQEVNGARVVRDVKNFNSMAEVLDQIHNLVDFVDSLTEKMSKRYSDCSASGNCKNADGGEKPSRRRKRELDDSEEDDDVQEMWNKMTTLLGGMTGDNNRETGNEIKKSAQNGPSSVNFQNDPSVLQKRLNDLKQQLDIKRRTHPSRSFGHGLHLTNSKPQSRASYNPPVNYYQQPGYNNRPYYPQPVYYNVYEYEDKDKSKDKDKDKFTKIKFKKSSKKVDKFDKIFTKILDKIIDKVIKAIPTIVQKLFGLEIDKAVDNYEGDDYYNDGYGVQKQKSFGVFSFIPMIIFKILSNISYFIKKLKKNPFIKTFLIPGFVTVSTAGLVVFLIWWLSGDDHKDDCGYGGNYHKNDYGYGGNYHKDDYGYGGNVGYDNYGYRSNSDSDDVDLNNNRLKNSQQSLKSNMNDFGYSPYNNGKFVTKPIKPIYQYSYYNANPYSQSFNRPDNDRYNDN